MLCPPLVQDSHRRKTELSRIKFNLAISLVHGTLFGAHFLSDKLGPKAHGLPSWMRTQLLRRFPITALRRVPLGHERDALLPLFGMPARGGWVTSYYGWRGGSPVWYANDSDASYPLGEERASLDACFSNVSSALSGLCRRAVSQWG